MIGEQRSTAARVGIAALNLLQPGLGLLRLGRLRPALFFLLAPTAAFAALMLSYIVLPPPGVVRYLLSIALALVLVAVAYVGSMILSWRGSRAASPRLWWTRWYSIAGVLLVATLAAELAGAVADAVARSTYRPFYIPSEAMLPSLVRDDKLLAAMGRPLQIRRGDLLLVSAPRDLVYIKRVAALPGDRIAMADDTVVLNGEPVRQRLLRIEPYTASNISHVARRLAEQFPGEASAHQIYDLVHAPDLDDMAEVVVRPGHLFMLGDNRDQSADSRVPQDFQGLGQVSVSAVKGRPLFIYWSPDRSRVGIQLSR